MQRPCASRARLTVATLFIVALTLAVTTAAVARWKEPQPAAVTPSVPRSAQQTGTSRSVRLQIPTAQQQVHPDSQSAVSSGLSDPLLLLMMSYPTEYYAKSVDIADVNNDGKPDLLVTTSPCLYVEVCGGAGGVSVLLGNGDGTFQGASSYASGGYGSTSLEVADVNADGKPDLLITSLCESSTDCTSGVVAVLLGNGDGTFQAAVPYSSQGVMATSLAIADVNGDGKPDLLVANCIANGVADIGCGGWGVDGSVSVLLGRGDGTFQTGVSYDSGGAHARSLAVEDVNGDGKPDLVVANQCTTECSNSGAVAVVGVLLGKGDGTFQTATIYNTGGVYANSVAVADVNGDGKPDLLVANVYASPDAIGDGIIGVLLGNGDGTFTSPLTYDSGGLGAASVVAADVDGDGHQDLVVANNCNPTGSCTGKVALLLGNGDGTFDPAVTFDSTGSALSVRVGDLNADGRQDVAVATYPASVDVLLNDSGPHTSTTTTLSSSANPQLRNQNVTYTAAVAAQSGHAIGAVTFFDGNAAIATIPLSNGRAAYDTSYPKIGTHVITASYPGDSANLPSTSASLTEDVSAIRLRPTTVVTTSGSPSFIGQAVTFTATVTWAYGVVPDGELVTFYDGPTPIATEATVGGKATFTTSALSVKTHNIRGFYPGDSSLLYASGSVTQVVSLFSTTTGLSSNLNPSNYGQAVTLTAQVAVTGASAPTGTVKFMNGTTSLGTVSLDSTGKAALTTTRIAVGSNSLTASYSGDSLNGKSTSTPLIQIVNQATIGMTLTSSPDPSTLGKSVKFAATLTSNGGLPHGIANPVTFTSGDTTLGTATISSSGVATFSTNALPQGANQVTATYGGGADYLPATSSVTQTVH